MLGGKVIINWHGLFASGFGAPLRVRGSRERRSRAVFGLAAAEHHAPEYLRHHDQRQQTAGREQRIAGALHAG